MEREPERAARARRAGESLRSGLGELGFDTGVSSTPLVPVILGPDAVAYRWARALWDEGFFASAVVYPAVARSASRLRLCGTAAYSDADLKATIEVFARLRERVGAVRMTSAAG